MTVPALPWLGFFFDPCNILPMGTNSLISQDVLLQQLAAFQGRPVLVLGDTMLDEYLVGEVDRISPEAPVPVVDVREQTFRLGGAGNVALNIAALGGKPHLISLAGIDEHGARLMSMLEEEGIESHIIQDAYRSTTVKTRIIANNQQVVRYDRETRVALGKTQIPGVLDSIDSAMVPGGVVIVSDYAKGMITHEIMDALIKRAKDKKWRILVDPSLVNIPHYVGVTMLTPNLKEAAAAAGMHNPDTEQEILRTGFALFKKLRCVHLLITLGARGLALFEEPDQVMHIPTFAKQVFDVTGAGDTIIAAMGLSLAAGCNLQTSSVLANYAAGIVVGKVGTAFASQDELRQAITTLEEPNLTQWLKDDRK